LCSCLLAERDFARGKEVQNFSLDALRRIKTRNAQGRMVQTVLLALDLRVSIESPKIAYNSFRTKLRSDLRRFDHFIRSNFFFVVAVQHWAPSTQCLGIFERFISAPDPKRTVWSVMDQWLPLN
jgi:hypothetical protein